MKAVKKSERGYTLITTMLVMIVLFVIGIAGAMLIYYGNMTSGAMINYSKAYYNADYGLQQVAYNAMTGVCSCANNGCGMSQTLPTGGTVQVITQSDTNNKTCFIESIGTGQTGGEVAKAVAISTGTSNWAALGVINNVSVNLGGLLGGFFGSAAINGCDVQDGCEAPGILHGQGISINIGYNVYTCNNVPNNPNGILGSPPIQITPANNIAQMITPYNNFSNFVSALAKQACPPDGTSCLTNVPSPFSLPQSCVCLGAATSTDGQTIQCNSPNQTLSSSCPSYYIAGLFTALNGFNLNNQNLYAIGGVDLGGNLNLNNSTMVLDGGSNFNFDAVVNATNSNIYASGSMMNFAPGSVLSGTRVYNGIGGVTFEPANGQNITADLCGGNPCTSSNESIVYTNGILNINGPIQGGLLYGNGGLSIQGVNGNRDVGTATEPVVAISGIGTNASMTISMSGTTQFNGLIMSWLMGSFTIGNNQINGGMYVNNMGNFSIGGNASINFNYAILSQIASAFPNLFNPVNCYANGPQQVMLNAVTLY